MRRYVDLERRKTWEPRDFGRGLRGAASVLANDEVHTLVVGEALTGHNAFR